MSRWVSTCRQSAPRAPRSGSRAWMCATLSHFFVPIRVLGLRAGTQVPAAPLPGRCPGTAPPQCSSDPARAPAGLSPGSYAFAAQAVGSSTACGTQAAPWGIYHLLRSTASATNSFSASICGAESQWQGRWTPRRYHLAA